ncbi:unnamed protein product, partial [Scytosiphon promiscuus]
PAAIAVAGLLLCHGRSSGGQATLRLEDLRVTGIRMPDPGLELRLGVKRLCIDWTGRFRLERPGSMLDESGLGAFALAQEVSIKGGPGLRFKVGVPPGHRLESCGRREAR